VECTEATVDGIWARLSSDPSKHTVKKLESSYLFCDRSYSHFFSLECYKYLAMRALLFPLSIYKQNKTLVSVQHLYQWKLFPSARLL